MRDNSYKNWNAMSDTALLEHIGSYIQHNRLKQNKSQSELAKAAGMSRSTWSLLERGEKVTLNTLIQALRTLDLLHALEAFNVTQEISPILYAKEQKNKRLRASGKSNENKEEDLGW